MCKNNQTIVTNVEEPKQGNLKDLYDVYNKSREYELDNFWKNSMFVWTFIVVCLTVFGTVVLNFKDPNLNLFENSASYFLLFTSTFGLSLSIVWYWMANALKVRSKINEVPVWKLENIDSYFGKDNIDKLAFNYSWSKETPFSPSRLVMLIGKMLIAFWGILIIFSVLTFPFFNQYFNIIILLVFVFVPIIIIVWNRIRGNFNSSSIRNKDEQDVFKKVKNYLLKKSIFRYFEVKEGNVIFFYTQEEYQSMSKKVEDLFTNCSFKDYPEMDYSRYFKYNQSNIESNLKKDDNDVPKS